VIIRSRGDSELAECVRILAEVHRRDGYPMVWPDDPAGFLAKPDFLGAWVAIVDGRPAGHVALSPPGHGDAAPALLGRDAAAVSRLFVAPAVRGRGAGAALLEHAAREAHRRGLHPVLDVLANSTSPIAWYERMGWRLLGTGEAQWGQRRVTVRGYAGPGPASAPRPAAAPARAPAPAPPAGSPSAGPLPADEP
jgi:GNAT superfamily N-acetyltransferase